MSPTTKPKTSPLIPIAGVLVLLCAGLATLKSRAALSGADSDVEAPALLSPDSARCPVADPAQAAVRATAAEHEARVKREQFPFEPADGVDAFRLWGEASACYRLSGDTAAHDRTFAAREDWGRIVGEHYAALRLRLQVAQRQQRDVDALEAVRDLQRLLRDRRGPYLDWLRETRDALERQQAATRGASRAP